MDELWDSFSQWLQTNYNEGFQDLRAPATDPEILELEAVIECTLPDGFVNCLKIHNGQNTYAGRLFNGAEFLSTHRIADEWRVWQELLDQGDFDGCYSEPTRGIKHDWWNPKWIPFTYDGSGNHLCIDLDPDVGGDQGQVITMWHDDPVRTVKAASFDEWFHEYLMGVLKGDFVYAEEYGGIVSKDNVF